MKYIKGTASLIEKTYLTDYLLELKFKLNNTIEWIPGQFMNINVGGDNWRSYSILDHAEGVVTFFVDIRPGGVGSIFLNNIDIGEQVNVIGPFGKFLLNSGDQHIFVCTGTGSAPVIPMVKKLLDAGNYGKITLLYGVRYDNEDLLERYLTNEQLKKIDCVKCITKTIKVKEVYKGRVTEYLMKNITDLSRSNCYICGNPEMVTQAIEIAKEKGCESIITEKY